MHLKLDLGGLDVAIFRCIRNNNLLNLDSRITFLNLKTLSRRVREPFLVARLLCVYEKKYAQKSLENLFDGMILWYLIGQHFGVQKLRRTKFFEEQIFGTTSKFRQFFPTKIFHRFLISPYN